MMGGCARGAARGLKKAHFLSPARGASEFISTALPVHWSQQQQKRMVGGASAMRFAPLPHSPPGRQFIYRERRWETRLSISFPALFADAHFPLPSIHRFTCLIYIYIYRRYMSVFFISANAYLQLLCTRRAASAELRGCQSHALCAWPERACIDFPHGAAVKMAHTFAKGFLPWSRILSLCSALTFAGICKRRRDSFRVFLTPRARFSSFLLGHRTCVNHPRRIIFKLFGRQFPLQ